MTVDIRPAEAADLDAVAQVFYRAFRRGYRGVLADDVVDGIEQIRPREAIAWQVTLAGVQHLVAVRGDAVLGFTRVALTGDEPGVGGIGALYVDPDHAGRGIGRALLDASFGLLADHGCAQAVLWVFEANTRARELYERVGLTLDGATHVSPEFRATELRMRRALSPAGR